MELMGIESSRVKGTSRNRLYACLGLRWFTRKESKDHSVRRETISKEKRRKSRIKNCSRLCICLYTMYIPRVFLKHIKSIEERFNDLANLSFDIPCSLK